MTQTFIANILYITVIILVIFALIYITIYVSEQVYLNKQSKKPVTPQLPPFSSDQLPLITIQLPIYNEKYVIETLLDSIYKMEYPTDKIEVQILDDSTDETSEIIKDYFNRHSQVKAISKYIKRDCREGFKAGALAKGLETASGEYIAIFDSDFRPNPDFLKETIRYFTSDQVAAVQTRWGFVNKRNNIITYIQKILISNHFLIEQYGRYAGSLLLQFSGTAGIWRKEAIIEAGGWLHDTIIEDVDLSLRSQLKGRKIVLAKDIVCPGELPTSVTGIKTQQFRWMQGSAQVVIKHLKKILSSDFSFSKKYHAFAYLTTSFIYLAIFSLAILSVPFLWVLNNLDIHIQYSGFFFLLMLIVGIIFYQNTKGELESKSVFRRITFFAHLSFYLIVLNFGISFQNTIAIIKGLSGIETPFKRTPKYNIEEAVKKHSKIENYTEKADVSPVWEIIIAIYFMLGILYAFVTDNFLLIDLHICMVLAFSSISILSLKPQNKRG